jgi:ribosomal protein S18 acetylase RimI-like enzyme
MQLVLDNIETPEWLVHMKPDKKRYNETLFFNKKLRDHRVKGYITPRGNIRFVLFLLDKRHSHGGVSTLTGRISDESNFYLEGIYTPSEYRGQGLASMLMLEVVETYRKIYGDTQNTLAGVKIMDKVGNRRGINYYRPQCITQESYLSQMEDAEDVRHVEILRDLAFDIAILEVAR